MIPLFRHARVKYASMLLFFLLVEIGCGGSDSPSVSPTPGSQPLVAVVFQEAEQTVREGNTALVNVAYSVTGRVDYPMEMLLAVGGDVSEDDYKISTKSLKIPVGEAGSGEMTFEVDAVEDTQFAEDNEFLLLSFGDETHRIVIEDGGVRPCEGVFLSGRLIPNDFRSLIRGGTEMVSLTLEVDATSADVVLEWLGPYVWQRRLHQDVSLWSFEPTGTGVRHNLEVEWGTGWKGYPDLEFRFRSTSDACSGDPEAVCTADGCKLRE